MKFENRGGYIVVPATVNSRLQGTFLVDTGADISVVTPQFAEQLSLQTIGHHTGGVAGSKQISIPLSKIQNIAVDNHAIALTPIAIIDLNTATAPYGAIDGIIGSDFLREFPVTIDYPKGVLVFEDSASLASRQAAGVHLPLILKGAMSPFLAVNINNRVNCEFKLDTGAGITQIPKSDLILIEQTTENHPIIEEEKNGLAGTYKVVRTTIDSFSLGAGLEVQRLPVQSYECDYGFIGANYLRHFALTLNYKEQYVIVGQSIA